MKIAVIIGRFQTYELHPGYTYLLDYVQANSDGYIIFLGSSRTVNLKNPLEFKPRKLMIENYVNKKPIEILEIMDVGNVDLWSKNLDDSIDIQINLFLLDQSIQTDVQIELIGSRDSFANNYNGKYNVKLIESNGNYNSTDLRVGIKFKKSLDFLLGYYSASVNISVGLTNDEEYNEHNSEWLQGYIFYVNNNLKKN